MRSLEQNSPRPDPLVGFGAARYSHSLNPGTDIQHHLPNIQGESSQGQPERRYPDYAFGESSSTNSFLNQVNSITDTLKQQERPDILLSRGEKVNLLSRSPAIPIRNSSLPDPDVALALMECFWQIIHPIFPLLHRPSVQRSYQLLCQPHGVEEGKNALEINLFQAILNVVFAVGTQYDNQLPFEQRIAAADSFYQKSRKLVFLDSIDTPTQSHIQLFLLTAIYLHTTSYANRCWDMIGAGLRVAIGLGIHREKSRPSASESQLEREMRRRVWYCCVILDK